MVQEVKEAGVEQEALADCLAEILRENGVQQIGVTQFSDGFHLTFDGDHTEGDRVVGLLRDVAEQQGYKIGWVHYELTYAPDKEWHRRGWRMCLIDGS